MRGLALTKLASNQSGAVAVTYALALTGLIAVAGVGFDFGRLASMDSELQDAADEAALAAATQLDGKSGAITRAQNAVNNYFANSGSSVVNRSLNAHGASALTGVNFTFYTSYDSATDAFGSTTTADSSAKVVKLGINGREVFYALTPVVGLLTSGNVTANAVAGLESGTCKLPPLMVCGPSGSDFPTSSDIGKGLLLKNASGAWAPGNFGYVDFGNGGNTVKQLMGTNSASDACVGGGTLTSEPGQIASATDYMNTRFDIYTSSLTASSCANNGDYCPAKSTRKDFVIKEDYTFAKVSGPPLATPQTYPTAPTRPACGAAIPTGGSRVLGTNWMLMPPASLPTNTVIGFPRDTCHYGGSCGGGNIGNGTWNLSGYRSTHPNVPGGLTTRYAIYQWERDNPGSGLQSSVANTGDPVQWTIGATGNGNGACKKNDANCGYTAIWTNYCSYPNPKMATYHATPKDRRLMTVAVVDCAGASGKSTLAVNKWMDVFLTEPSLDRTSPVTDKKDIYGEVVSVATKPDGTNAFQYYSRNKAVLLR